VKQRSNYKTVLNRKHAAVFCTYTDKKTLVTSYSAEKYQ